MESSLNSKEIIPLDLEVGEIDPPIPPIPDAYVHNETASAEHKDTEWPLYGCSGNWVDDIKHYVVDSPQASFNIRL